MIESQLDMKMGNSLRHYSLLKHLHNISVSASVASHWKNIKYDKEITRLENRATWPILSVFLTSFVMMKNTLFSSGLLYP